jgi:hypothetical protein
MPEMNFIIGRGEVLTHDIVSGGAPHDKAEAYTFDEAKTRLEPQIALTVSAIEGIPPAACPQDYAVARFSINPSYIAKSFYPSSLFNIANLRPVGSRAVSIVPEKWTKKKLPARCSTTEIFVAGKRGAFRELLSKIMELEPENQAAIDFSRIETVLPMVPADRNRVEQTSDAHVFEACVHLFSENDGSIESSFDQFARHLGFTVHHPHSFQAGTLWFVPLSGPISAVPSLAAFSMLRVVRPAPRLRGLIPIIRSSEVTIPATLPAAQPLSSLPKVAIMDGGLPGQHPIGDFIRSYRLLDELSYDHPVGPDHGLAVTSAFLFGPLLGANVASRPYSFVDHLRVLDRESTAEDPLEMYRTLGFIEQVLLSRQYEFINLSLGPDLPIEDADVHAWTS